MKMKAFVMRTLSALLAGSCCIMASCKKEEAFTATDTLGQTDTQQTDTSYEETKKETDTADTSKPVTEKTLSLKWNLGYVASSTHASKPNQIVSGSGGGYYSYTDVFTVDKAGTTLTFTDNNTNSNGDAKFASASAYVVSSWKQEGSEWVIDLDGANYAGSNTTLSDILVSYSNGTVTYSYTTTLDNENLRLCFRSGQSTAFTPTAFPTVTATLTGRTGTAAEKLNLAQWIEDSISSYYAQNLEELTVYAIGDSYFEGNGLLSDYVWLSLMSKKYGIELHNYGKNGSTVSNYVTSYNPMCDRYTSLPDGSPDIILVEGGRNDFNQKVPIGAADSSDTKTYSGALNVIIDGLQKKYPSAMIVCVTPWNFPDKSGYSLTYKDYTDAMEEVAEAQGVYCVKAYEPEISGVNMRDDSFKSKYCMKPGDVSHLNLDGMKIAMSHFEKIIAQYYADFSSK